MMQASLAADTCDPVESARIHRAVQLADLESNLTSDRLLRPQSPSTTGTGGDDNVNMLLPWCVLFQPGVRVREAPKPSAAVVARLRAGEKFRAKHAAHAPGWVQLEAALGYILIETQINAQRVVLLSISGLDSDSDGTGLVSDDQLLDGRAFHELLEDRSSDLCKLFAATTTAFTSASASASASAAQAPPPSPSPSTVIASNSNSVRPPHFPSHEAFAADAFDHILRLLPCPATSLTPTADPSAGGRPPPEAALLLCRLVCHEWRLATRHVLSDPRWLAAHLPLRSLLERRCSARAVAFRLAAAQDEAMATVKRRTVLHLAIECRADLATIDALLALNPKAAGAADLRLVLPLHLLASLAPLTARASASSDNGHGLARCGGGEEPPCESAAGGAGIATAALAAGAGGDGGAVAASAGTDAGDRDGDRGGDVLSDGGDDDAKWRSACARRLLDFYPLGRCLYTKERKTALHLACESGAPAAFVQVLLQGDGGGGGGGGSRAASATSTAAVVNVDEPVIARLSGLTVEQANQRLKVNESAVRPGPELVLGDPRLSSHALALLAGKGEASALHLAAGCGRPTSAAVVRALLRVAPDSARCRDREGRLPIHYAIEACTIGSREALKASAEGEGRAPASAAYLEVVAQLLDAHPVSQLSWSCLDLLRLGPLGKAALKRKLAAEPWRALEVDDAGRLLLHHTARSRAAADLVDIITALHPDAARQQDKDSRLPLHYALEHNPPIVAVIEALLGTYPAGGMVGFGDQPYEVVRAVRERSFSGLQPCHQG